MADVKPITIRATSQRFNRLIEALRADGHDDYAAAVIRLRDLTWSDRIAIHESAREEIDIAADKVRAMGDELRAEVREKLSAQGKVSRLQADVSKYRAMYEEMDSMYCSVSDANKRIRTEALKEAADILRAKAEVSIEKGVLREMARVIEAMSGNST